MAFKTIVDLSTDTVISLGGTNRKTGKKNPVSIEGYYLGCRQRADKKNKRGFSYIYTFQTVKGNVGVWGKTDMDRKLASVIPGCMMRVSFSKMVPTPNGEMYKYDVEFDADNTIEVTGSSNGTEFASDYAENEGGSGGYEEAVVDDGDEDTEELVEAPPAKAAVASTTNRARLDAILARAKTK